MVPDEVSLYCPHCGKHTAVTPALLSVIVPSPGMPNGIAEDHISRWIQDVPYYHHGAGRWWLGKCNACKQPVLVKDRGSKVYPTPQPGPVSEDIPDPMRRDMQEAKVCLGAGAYLAAVLMARRVLQATCLQKQAQGSNLAKQIDDLATKNIITADIREWAHATRFVGNDAAHPEAAEVAGGPPPFSKEDAEDAVNLTESILEVLYVATAKARAQLARMGRAPAP